MKQTSSSFLLSPRGNVMTRFLSKSASIFPVLLLVSLVGCSGGNSVGTVSGEVKLDGQPLKKGIIRFVPVGGKSQTADTSITDGKFSATVPSGEKVVEITAPKVVGKQKMYDTPDSPVVETVAELLPARYNVRSELRLTVQQGSQEKHFELTSK
jgi:hypothetical protein